MGEHVNHDRGSSSQWEGLARQGQEFKSMPAIHKPKERFMVSDFRSQKKVMQFMWDMDGYGDMMQIMNLFERLCRHLESLGRYRWIWQINGGSVRCCSMSGDQEPHGAHDWTLQDPCWKVGILQGRGTKQDCIKWHPHFGVSHEVNSVASSTTRIH